MVVVANATSLRGRKGGVAVYGAARGAQRGYMKTWPWSCPGNINATAQTRVDNITIGPWSIARQRSFASEWPKTGRARRPGLERAQTVLFLLWLEKRLFLRLDHPVCGGWTV